ncbi:MAG: secretion system protein [Acidobacteria bacterium]|nr:MAG: secretion system protein [Acidobacteriota bacterium]
MTSVMLFGSGLFALLLFLCLYLFKGKIPPQSVMLEQVTRQARAGGRGAIPQRPDSSVLVRLLAKPFTYFRGLVYPRPDAETARRLSLAGYREPIHVDIFLGSRLAVPAALGIFVTLLVQENILVFLLIAAVIGFFVPDFWLAEAVKARRRRISQSLPDGLDLMSICMDAGLSLDQAILRVGNELRPAHPDLSQEFLQINFEQRAGVPRLDCWTAFANRINLEELRQFVAMLTQTERFGTPIAAALLAFSETLRGERRQKAEELGAKAAIKLLFPLVFFIFPMVFIVTIGPAIIGLLQNLEKLLE